MNHILNINDINFYYSYFIKIIVALFITSILFHPIMPTPTISIYKFL